jgi:hypothetical protein
MCDKLDWVKDYKESLRKGFPVSMVDSYRVVYLIEEIEKLKSQLAESESVRKSIEDNYTRLQQTISQLPESVQDDIADKCAELNCYHD